mgnify:CR=1 FL=1
MILIISVITVITAGFLFYRVEQNTLDDHTILLEATNRHFHLFHSRLGKTSHQQRRPDKLADDGRILTATIGGESTKTK